MSQASRSIQKEGRVVVVEGYTDVIMAHQFGFEYVVAVLGTAVTQDHVRLLRRYADKAVLLLDQDTAGQNSAERSVDAFVAEGMPVTVGRLDSDKDPCDFLLARGAEPFAQALGEGKEAVAFKIERVKEASGGRLDAPGALDSVIATLGLIADPVAREFAMKEVVRLTGVSEAALQAKLSQDSRPLRRAVAKAAKETGFRGKRDPERELLCVMLWGGDCVDLVKERLDPAWIGDATLLRLIQRAMQLRGEAGGVDASSLLARCQDEVERAIVEEAMAGEAEQSDESDGSGKSDYSEWCSQLLVRLQALHAELSNKGFGERLRAAGNYEEQKQLMDGYGKLARRAQRKIGFGKNLVS
jgi:DNA primase